MNLEKLEFETSRLSLEVEKKQLNLENVLRRGFLLFAYQILFALVIIYFSPESYKVVVLIVSWTFLWELVASVKNWFQLREAKKILQSWTDTVSLANQNVE